MRTLGAAHPIHADNSKTTMNKQERLEAERIAGELEVVERVFRRTGQPSLDPSSMETMLLAKAAAIFEGTLEADPLTPEQRAMRAFAEAL